MGNPHEELLSRARSAIRELRAKLAEGEARNRRGPIAVIGVGLRFPGVGSDPEQFWKMIADGRDAVGPVPADRWDREALFARDAAVPGKINTRHASFLENVRRFDAGFFDITPREAARMDPQQRLFLETAWHALEDAGLRTGQLEGSQTGVFVGVHNHSADYQAMQFRSVDQLDAWSATGTAHDMIGGRLAYWLDLHGPALTVNTACSSSLTAVHLACRSLQARDCTMALAGGVNLLLEPGSTVAAAQLQLLSPDGHCRTFDARANGMGRGEGCGVVVLKRLSEAQKDGDRVLAVIRGSAANQDGRTNGLTAPNGLAQQLVLRQALADAEVDPAEIGYVETHGTGTAIGDPIEVEALAAILGGGRRRSPCRLGAVKASLGHLEGAAGVAGLIKAVMVLRKRWIPPVANLQVLNPHLAMEGSGLEIPRSGHAWTSDSPRLAGVSSFGWSGTNVHVVLEEAPAEKYWAGGTGPWPVLVSAKSKEALADLALAYSKRLENADGNEMAAISYTSAVRRTHHSLRIGVIGADAQAMAAELRRRALPSSTRNAGNDKRLAHWESGGDVNWEGDFEESGAIVDLPRYPFKGRDYWIEPSASDALHKGRSAPRTVTAPGTADRSLRDWLYSVAFVEQDNESPRDPMETRPAAWLILGAKSRMSMRLTQILRLRGHVVVEAPTEDLAGPDRVDLAKLVTEAGVNTAGLLRTLFIAGEQNAVELTIDALQATLAVLDAGLPTRIWFVIQGAESIGGLASLTHPSHAGLRGFSRVFGLEHPEISAGVIDADIANPEAILEEVSKSSSEDRVVLRGGRRWVARLRRARIGQADVLRLKPQSSYLVTGAFGSLGMEIAAWLVARGARHLVLLGRTDPKQTRGPGIWERIETWRAKGIQVRALACDVANELAVSNLVASLEQDGTPLAGVIHAAGAVSFHPLQEAVEEDVRNTFRAKVEGASVLDRCTCALPLDFFVLFSSAAASIGLRNGCIYAAANSALEALAAERSRDGLPALCVESGAWAGSKSSAQADLIRQSGFQPMEPEQALHALELLIANRRTAGIVADIDWSVLGPALESRGRAAFVTELIEGTGRPADAEVGREAVKGLDEFRSLPAEERRFRLLDFVSGEVRQVFGMRQDDVLGEERGLFEMGMNSLMSVRLRERLTKATGLRLPGTLVFTYPTVSKLAEYFELQLFGSAKIRQAGGIIVPKGDDQDLAVVAQMDDAETNAAIAAELAAVQRTLAGH
jgi:acyl transferase domain-containing protein